MASDHKPIEPWVNDIHEGDAREVLQELPESSVHMMMTSPPYFGLRDYGHDDQIGLEETLDEYINELVQVFREVRRVLRPDGSAWLNLGDSYAKTGSGQPTDSYKESVDAPEPRGDEFGRKNKMLVPHRVAIVLQEDGWVVRNDCTWLKPNPMPSSAKDRLNTTTEQVFHLVPEPDYWYDLDAIREPHAASTHKRYSGDPAPAPKGEMYRDKDAMPITGGENKTEHGMNPLGKNPGDVFEVTTQPFPDAHFAVYPAELCEKPIKATCPPQVCAECGTPYERRRETEDRPDRRDRNKPRREYDGNTEDHNNRMSWVGMPKDVVDEWWEQCCDCDTDDTEPGIVLDPFAGAGTTCLEAKRLERKFIGIDLNPEYVAMAQKRLSLTVDQPELLVDDESQATLDTSY